MATYIVLGLALGAFAYIPPICSYLDARKLKKDPDWAERMRVTPWNWP